jgi:hypothetical protein
LPRPQASSASDPCCTVLCAHAPPPLAPRTVRHERAHGEVVVEEKCARGEHGGGGWGGQRGVVEVVTIVYAVYSYSVRCI